MFFRKAEENLRKTSQIYDPDGQVFNFVKRKQQKIAAKTLLWLDRPTADQGLWLQKGLHWEISPWWCCCALGKMVANMWGIKQEEMQQFYAELWIDWVRLLKSRCLSTGESETRQFKYSTVHYRQYSIIVQADSPSNCSSFRGRIQML